MSSFNVSKKLPADSLAIAAFFSSSVFGSGIILETLGKEGNSVSPSL